MKRWLAKDHEAALTAAGAPDEPGWWCSACEGSGAGMPIDGDETIDCYTCGGPARESMRFEDVAVVASVGPGELLRFAELAREIARTEGFDRSRVVWRVMSSMDVNAHLIASTLLTKEHGFSDAVRVFAQETKREKMAKGIVAWTRENPLPHVKTVQKAWPPMRALAIGEDAAPKRTGAHLIRVTPETVAIGIEAIEESAR